MILYLETTILLTVERVSPLRDQKGMSLSGNLNNVCLVGRAPLTVPKEKWELVRLTVVNQANHGPARPCKPRIPRVKYPTKHECPHLHVRWWLVGFRMALKLKLPTSAANCPRQVLLLLLCFPHCYIIAVRSVNFSMLVWSGWILSLPVNSSPHSTRF